MLSSSSEGSSGQDRARSTCTFRQPRPSDAVGIWQVVRRSQSLEPNSGYAYVLICSHFAGTSLVAESGGRICGFVAAYRPPTDPEAIFVWQVGVDSAQRRGGIALEMLLGVCRRDGCRDAHFLLATVDPGNEASAKLFRAFARKRQAAVGIEPGFPAALFPEEGHPEEQLYRIGPLLPQERKD